MLSDKYIPYNDEWKYRIDVLNILERIANVIAPIEDKVVEEVAVKKTKRTKKKEVN